MTDNKATNDTAPKVSAEPEAPTFDVEKFMDMVRDETLDLVKRIDTNTAGQQVPMQHVLDGGVLAASILIQSFMSVPGMRDRLGIGTAFEFFMNVMNHAGRSYTANIAQTVEAEQEIAQRIAKESGQ